MSEMIAPQRTLDHPLASTSSLENRALTCSATSLEKTPNLTLQNARSKFFPVSHPPPPWCDVTISISASPDGVQGRTSSPLSVPPALPGACMQTGEGNSPSPVWFSRFGGVVFFAPPSFLFTCPL